MSLEAIALEVRKALPAIKKLDVLSLALDEAANAEQLLAAAKRELAEKLGILANAKTEIVAAHVAVDDAKREADNVVAEAREQAAKIKQDAKVKADAALEKARAKASEIETQAAVAEELFTSKRQTNEEVLAMLQAQIAHAEAKLSEIRAAIAKITGG